MSSHKKNIPSSCPSMSRDLQQPHNPDTHPQWVVCTILFTTCSYIYKLSHTSKAVFKVNSELQKLFSSLYTASEFTSIHSCWLCLTKNHYFFGSEDLHKGNLISFIPLQSWHWSSCSCFISLSFHLKLCMALFWNSNEDKATTNQQF